MGRFCVSPTNETNDTHVGLKPDLPLRPWADAFPYVNGGLFAGSVAVPRFSRIARTYLLHAGHLNWKHINPDIFGSMIQAVADDDERKTGLCAATRCGWTGSACARPMAQASK